MSRGVVRVGLIGDPDVAVTAHRAVPLALSRVGAERPGNGNPAVLVESRWLATEELAGVARSEAALSAYLARFDALWCVPATPYRSAEGALAAICWARESHTPFLGTCGGFQHAVIDIARNVWGVVDADHEERSPLGESLVIQALQCSLVEVEGDVRFTEGSRTARAYASTRSREGYHCRFGFAPRFRPRLEAGPLRATGFDDAGDVRAVELDEHPFFVATLFQPERAALSDRDVPLARALVEAAAR